MIFFIPRSRPLRMVWEVRKGDKRSFLIGTAHFFPYSFKRSLTKLIEHAQVVVLEGPLDEHNMAKVTFAGVGTEDAPHLFDYLDTHTIADITDAVTPHCRDKSRLVLFSVMNPWMENPVYTMLKGMKPWRAFFTLYSQFLKKHGWKFSVDMDAYSIAQEMGKKTIFLETIDEQIEVLESLCHDQIIDFLKRIDQWKTYMREYVKWYLEGDLERIKSNRYGFPTRHPSVIDRRDEILYERMRPYVRKGGSVICVGAPHVLRITKMLLSDGYEVRRWNPDSRPWD